MPKRLVSGMIDRKDDYSMQKQNIALQVYSVREDMQKDFNNYGSNFTFTLIDTISDSSEVSKEYQWMNNFRSHIRGVGYNYKDNVMKFSQGVIEAEEQNEKMKNEICRLLQKTRDSDLLDFILKMLQKSK